MDIIIGCILALTALGCLHHWLYPVYDNRLRPWRKPRWWQLRRRWRKWRADQRASWNDALYKGGWK